MTVDELLSNAKISIEARFVVVPGPACAVVGGMPYVAICSGGPKTEGDLVPALYSTPQTAIVAWLDAMFVYGVTRGKCLYWWQEPKLEVVLVGNGQDERPFYCIYSRVLVTDTAWPEITCEQEVEPYSGNIFVSNGTLGFLITRNEILDNLAELKFAAGLKLLQEKQRNGK